MQKKLLNERKCDIIKEQKKRFENRKMDKERKIILASNSPRRKEILEKEGFSFQVFVPKGEEYDIIGKKYSDELVEKCAEVKARNVYNALNTDELMIVSCDTVVVNDGIILGKPKDKLDAFNTLKSLSGKKHRVVSAVCVIKSGIIKVANEKTEVTFRKLTSDDINNYIERCKPYDKAGGYGIQDENFDFVVHIDGNIDNVIGFPMKTFKSLLNSIK